MKLSGPKVLLHLEGLGVLVAACLAYQAGGFAWWKFAAVFLAPDLAIVGYALGTKIGAVIYNAAHTYVAVGVVWLAIGWACRAFCRSA
jgi:hypothetical protein